MERTRAINEGDSVLKHCVGEVLRDILLENVTETLLIHQHFTSSIPEDETTE